MLVFFIFPAFLYLFGVFLFLLLFALAIMCVWIPFHFAFCPLNSRTWVGGLDIMAYILWSHHFLGSVGRELEVWVIEIRELCLPHLLQFCENHIETVSTEWGFLFQKECPVGFCVFSSFPIRLGQPSGLAFLWFMGFPPGLPLLLFCLLCFLSASLFLAGCFSNWCAWWSQGPASALVEGLYLMLSFC